ncbi:hypothetical protein VP01_1820g2 [Puccinia sorghi]|uniref:Uncharacterized protein n=1 Tax=Puccinia sorghi TaxID=27349 RepID=A0A0L6VE46_9BASI|nr:hypothetical protein VP01_1820g2 [Puccinia sorghi]
MKGKTRLISSEINILLIEHDHLMLAWMSHVELIWNQTRSAHMKPNHMWFDVIKVVKENLVHREIGEIDDALVDNQLDVPEVEGDAEPKGLDSGKEDTETEAAIVGSSVQDVPGSVDEAVGRDR